MEIMTLPFAFFLFDPRYFDTSYWFLVGPTILLALYAQFKVKSAYATYSRIGNSRGISGAEAAAEILRRNNVYDVSIEMTQGWLSDHYDPTSKTLRLSPDVYSGHSLASVGIAAHEAGHALQHAQSYALLGLRSFIAPMAQLGNLAVGIAVMGLFFKYSGLILVGVVAYFLITVFQLITLPVEFNASDRAEKALLSTGILTRQDEADGVHAVLSAAAMTYVAATLSAVMNLLYFAMRAGLLGGGRDD